MNIVERNIKLIHERILQACAHSGRNPEEVKLLLATKTVPCERIQLAIDLGETLIGENKVQEIQDKYPMLKHNPVEWHFIGHLQTNKVKDVLKYATMIQSVDRMKLAKALHDQLKKENRSIDILVQVNTSYEESKFGIQPEHTLEFIEQISELDTLKIKGLMTIGKFSADRHEVRKCFRLLKSIQKQAERKALPHVEMEILSMGMSGDLEIALEEGATMIRVGTAIFGERIYPDSYYWNEQLPVSD